MKRATLIVLLSFIFFFASYQGTFAQNKITTGILKADQITYKIEVGDFHVILSQLGKIVNYGINAEGDISYDVHNRLEQVGEVKISYDIHNRLDQVGDVKISYDLNNRIAAVGTEEISYDFNGRVSQIGKTKISYSISNGKISHIGR